MSEHSELLQHKFKAAFEEGAGDEIRRKILLHAADVFSRKGYTATKIKDIAASAGFSQGYVYSYYKSKEELFVKIAELALEGASQSVQWAAELPGTPLQRIRGLTEAYLASESLALRHWTFHLLLAVAAEGIPEEARSLAERKKTEPVRLLVPIIAEGQQVGEIAVGDPIALAIAYFSFMQGLGLTKAGMDHSVGTDNHFPDTELAIRFLKQ